MCNIKLRTEFFEVLIVELSSVVSDDGMRQFESVDDGFLDEVFHFTFDDLSQGFGFYPLGQIVDCDHYEFFLARHWGKRTEYVDSLLSKRPKCNNRH